MTRSRRARAGALAVLVPCVVACGAHGGGPARGPAHQVADVTAVQCSVGPMRLALERGWSCYPATEAGKPRGLGVVPFDAPLKGALLLSESFPAPPERTVEALTQRLTSDAASIRKRVGQLGGTKSLRLGEVWVIYLQGVSAKDRGAVRREGYVLFSGRFARLVEIVPSDTRSSEAIDRMIGSLRP